MKGNTLTIFDVNIFRPQYLLSFTHIHRLLKMYALLQYWLIIIYIYILICIYILPIELISTYQLN